MTEVRVLVVDDDPWILRMVSSSLEKKGSYLVDTARDGQQALRRVQASRPDMIITDVMMPVMDGWAFVQELRADPNFADIPVLFLTALGKDKDRLHALGLKPDDYLSKPFRFDDLERRVLTVMGKLRLTPLAPARVVEDPFGLGFGGAGASHPPPRPSAPVVPPPATRPVAQGPVDIFGTNRARPLAGGRGGAAADGYIDLEEPAEPEPSASGSFTGAMKRTGLSGRLEQLGLSSLLVMMEMERKDGVLQIQHGEDKRVGRIFLRRGQVIQSRIDKDNAQRDGRQCVYEMLCWQKGRFHFSVMDVDMEDLVHTSTTSLLMEGARLIDEANR